MKNIVIVGGGTAGWLTALFLNQHYTDSNITLIESSKIGILGAGEGTTGNIPSLFNKLNITIDELKDKVDLTIKTGISFENWSATNDKYFHPISAVFKKQVKKTHGFHFNARKLADLLKTKSIERGVVHIDDIVDGFISNEKNDIVEVKLKNLGNVKTDFIFDCSGFARLIIGKHYNSDWVSYDDYLKVNTAIPYFLKNEEKRSLTYTKAIAMKCGWMWQIPLQNRWGCGYIFDNNEISENAAKQEIIDFLGHDVEFIKPIKFNPGCYKKVWINNCVAIGLSGGFLEPLEATSLMTTSIQLEQFTYLYDTDGIKNKELYNTIIYGVNNQNMLFIYYHYLTNRDDSNFWKKIQKNSKKLPQPLDILIDENSNIIPENYEKYKSYFTEVIPFAYSSWEIINEGIKNNSKLI
jgi:tryptophan halogenase